MPTAGTLGGKFSLLQCVRGQRNTDAFRIFHSHRQCVFYVSESLVTGLFAFLNYSYPVVPRFLLSLTEKHLRKGASIINLKDRLGEAHGEWTAALRPSAQEIRAYLRAG